jgi:glutathione peroxidase-family protein
LAPPARAAGETNVYDFTVMQYGKPVSLDKYRGKVTVVVNVASE